MHAIVDGLGNPVEFMLSAGNTMIPFMLLNCWKK